MRRVVLFVNPMLAARGSRRTMVEHCAALLRGDGCVVEVRETLTGRAAGEQAREAVERGFDTIFACGGDGTLFQILQGVAGSEVALGVIPLGTGNVLAQNLRLPRDPVAALRVLRNAEAVSIPLGEVVSADSDGRERSWYFTMAAGMGFHAALMKVSPNGSAKRLWGRAVYYGGGLRLLATHPVPAFEVQLTAVGGASRRFCASELLAVRVPAINRWRAGGDLRATQLRIASVPQTGRGGLAHACFHALVTKRESGIERRGSSLPYPCYEAAEQVVCVRAEDTAHRAPLLVQADGEIIGAERAVIRMAERQIKLLWPELRL